MKIKKIYHYADSKVVYERNGGGSQKVSFTKSEYDALIREEHRTYVETSEFCDYLATANNRENKGDTFQAVLDRYRTHKYTTVEYKTTYNGKDIIGEVIYEDGRPVVISAFEDKIPHTLNLWRFTFAANLAFLIEKRLIPNSMR